MRLFEAGACGTPIISDEWQGLDSFFTIGDEILVARNRDDVLEFLQMPSEQRMQMAERLRSRVLQSHTAEHRALELEQYFWEASRGSARPAQRTAEERLADAIS